MDIENIDPDIKTRIEKLLKWLIPVFAITVIVELSSTQLVMYLTQEMTHDEDFYRTSVPNFLLIIDVFKNLDNVVVSVWLFYQAKDFKFHKMLWPFFGLIQPYFAIVFFFASLFLQNNGEMSSNPYQAPGRQE